MSNKTVSLERKQKKYGYIFTLPFIIGSIFFIVYPILLSLRFTLSDVSIGTKGYILNYVGIKNLKYLFLEDPNFNKTIIDTMKQMLVNIPIVVIFSFFIASMLNQEFKGRALARAILFLPVIVSSNIVNTLMTKETISSSLGSVSGSSSVTTDFSAALLDKISGLNLSTNITDLLISTINNISVVLAMSAIPIIIFLAGLQSISPSIYEASYVEGATKWEVFWKISLPMISPMILVVIVYAVVDSFTSTQNSAMEMVNNLCFDSVKFGVGCAAAWIYLCLVIVVLSAVFLVINKFIFYYND